MIVKKTHWIARTCKLILVIKTEKMFNTNILIELLDVLLSIKIVQKRDMQQKTKPI